MRQIKTLALAAMALAGCAGMINAGITLTDVKKQESGEKRTKLLVPVRDSHSKSLDRRTPGGKGIVYRNSSGKSNLPFRTIGNGSAILGYLHTSVSEELDGALFEFNEKGYTKVWEDSCKVNGGSKFISAWLNGDRFCGYSVYTMWGMVFEFEYAELNMKDGSIIKREEFDYYRRPNISVAAFNTSEEAICGYASSPTDGSMGWVRASAETPGEPEFVRVLDSSASSEVCYSLTYNPDDDNFYGVNMGQKFVKVDGDGRQTVIADVPDASGMDAVITGMVYSPKDKLFYWNYNTKGKKSGLYSITTDGKFTHLQDFADGEEFSVLLTTDAYTSSTKPQRPEITAVSFADGASSGKVALKLPAKYFDGTAISGNLDWHAMLDGQLYKEGKAAAGADVEVEYKDLSDGFHSFAFYTTIGNVAGPRASRRIFIGNDVPKAPANVKLDEKTVSWDAVTESVNGGYLAVAEMTYEVVIDGKPCGTTKETSMNVEIAPGPFRQMNAEVTAVCRGRRSAVGSSNSITYGDAMTLPVHFEVTEDEYNLMTVLDANDDGYSWMYSYGLTSLLADWIYDESDRMDDYIFLPPIKFEDPNRFYTFAMDIIGRSARYPDARYQVVLATSPTVEGVCDTIIAETNPPLPDPDVWDVDYEHFVNKEQLFKVKEAGTYYVGFQIVSPPAQMGFLIRNINILDENITVSSPAAATALTSEAAAQGKLSAKIGLTLPTTDLSGNALSSDTELTATITAAKSVKVSGKPGAKVAADVETVQGNNKVVVVVSQGELNSPKAFADVFTGVNAPKAVSKVEVEVAPDMLSATLSWDKVTEADNGGFINPETIEYDIYRLEEDPYGESVWNLIDTSGKETTYTYKADKQDLHSLAVGSRNEAGDCGKIYWLSVHVGAPYTLPMTEDFEDGYVTTAPWLNYPLDETYTGTLSTMALSEIDNRWFEMDGYALVSTVSGDGHSGMFGLPRFSTKGLANIKVNMEMLTGPMAPTVMLYGAYNGSDLMEIGTVKSTEDKLQDVEFTLPEALWNKEWVQVYVLSRFPKTDRMFVLNKVSVSGNVSVGSASVDGRIRGGKNSIIFEGFAGSDVEIYSMDGKVVKKAIAESSLWIADVEKGVYLVRCADRTAKVVVR